jgi:hypothetical protein
MACVMGGVSSIISGESKKNLKLIFKMMQRMLTI